LVSVQNPGQNCDNVLEDILLIRRYEEMLVYSSYEKTQKWGAGYTPGGNPGFSIVTTVILGFIDVLFI
jgi:hypothetical protein